MGTKTVPTLQALHKDINKPVKDFRKKWVPMVKAYVNVPTGAHKLKWAVSKVFLRQKIINVKVYLNFKKNDLSDPDYKKL